MVDDAAALEAREAAIRAAVLRCAPGANAEAKRVALATQYLTGDAMLDLAADSFARCLTGPEGREGVAAFLDKRAPSWTRGPGES